MATSAQVQQLYIALLGRAADKPGLDWWLENINGTEGLPGERTLEEAAAAFTTSEEFVATYGGLQGAELVTAVYSNLFERTPSADEVAYWVADGRPADQLLAAFLAYASPADQTVINNKVIVAQYYTDAAGADYDLADAAAIIADVDGTAGSVSNALGNLPVNNSAVLSTLGTWQAATEAKATFLAGLDLDDNAATDTAESDVTALLTDLAGPVKTFDSNLGANSTVAQQEAAFTAARNTLNTSIASKQAAVTDAQAAVTALMDSKDVNAYIAALNTAEETEEAKLPAAAAAAGAAVQYNKLGGAAIDTDADYVVDLTTGAVTVTASTALDGLVEVKDGALVLKPGVTETTNKGVTELLKALNADIAAQVADVKADNAVTAAQGKVGNGTSDYLKVDALIQAQEDLATEQAKSAELEDAITAVKDAYSLNGQLAKLIEAEGKALDAVEATLNGGKVDVVDDTDVGTTAGDVFVFNGVASTGVTFDSADDKLFIGSKYALVDITEAIADGKALGTDAFGSADTLEVFWDAGSSTLTFEKQAFSGNVAGSTELIDVVLTGVTDIELNNGFITEVA